MVILRHAPGSVAPAAGTYALVGHYGESTDFAVWVEKGDRLPFVISGADFGPLWFVQVGEANESARAA